MLSTYILSLSELPRVVSGFNHIILRRIVPRSVYYRLRALDLYVALLPQRASGGDKGLGALIAPIELARATKRQRQLVRRRRRTARGHRKSHPTGPGMIGRFNCEARHTASRSRAYGEKLRKTTAKFRDVRCPIPRATGSGPPPDARVSSYRIYLIHVCASSCATLSLCTPAHLPLPPAAKRLRASPSNRNGLRNARRDGQILF
ncbi:hypothetical protein EVAR_29360_1 [Eumeta japonica]|uniref:Uncharacterized protein n=1 Tax=Eumeta variegata TaxID=151549 RepID=A0A4C1WHF2_EUMVA|nr:hypothetical protein EVAR_29360_1 [Eumeta japonica]